MNLGYISSDQIRAEMPAGAAQPRITVGEILCLPSAQLKRLFPLSHNNELICIQDAAGEEVAILESLEGLDTASRAVVDQALDRRYFTPTILRIYEVEQEAGMWRFLVDTNRGKWEFYVRNWRDNAHELGSNRWQIYSVDGGRFDIPNLEKLDERSRKHMARLL